MTDSGRIWKYIGPAVPAVLIVGSIVFTFAPALQFPLLHGWDDNVYVTFNPRLDLNAANLKYWFTHSCVSCYLPLTMMSFMLDKLVWGLNPLGYHLQNLFWHLLACLALYGLMRECRVSRRVGAALVLLFAVHPQRVESVVWISERKDVLCAAFYAVALWCYVRAERGTRGWHIASILAFTAALLAKSMAVSLPAVLLAWRWHRDRGLDPRRLFRDLWPYVLLAGAAVPVAIACQSIPVDQTTHLRQFSVTVHNLFWYALKTVAPADLCPIYPKIEFSGSMIGILIGTGFGLVLLVFSLWRRSPGVCLYEILPSIGAYTAALAPVVGIMPLGYTDMSDRYSYIPSMFLWLAIAVLVERLRTGQILSTHGWLPRNRQRLLACGWGVFAIAFMCYARIYARAWSDIRILNQLACLREPANVFALKQLGDIELDAGHFPEAMTLGERLLNARRSWMTEGRREDTLAKGLYLCGFSLFQMEQFDEALDMLIQLRPYLPRVMLHAPTRNAAIWGMLADLYQRKGNPTEAVACYDAILRTVSADSYEGQFYLGIRAQINGDREQALEHFKRAAALRPGNPTILAKVRECTPQTEAKTPPRPDQ